MLWTVPRGKAYFGVRWGRSNRFALQRRIGEKEEALGLKRLLHSLAEASVAAMIILAANNTVCASDKQTLDPAQNTAEDGPILLAQSAAPREAKGSETANVNVD